MALMIKAGTRKSVAFKTSEQKREKLTGFLMTFFFLVQSVHIVSENSEQIESSDRTTLKLLLFVSHVALMIKTGTRKSVA